MITTKYRSDKQKTPVMHNFDLLSWDEIKAIKTGDTILILDRHECAAPVKVTSVKTWKRRPDVDIHCKFGLYEFFVISVYPVSQDKYSSTERIVKQLD